MVARVNGNEVVFTLPDRDLAKKDFQFMLYGIDVSMQQPCVDSCVVWEMVRPLNSNVALIEENFVQFPIKYGMALPNMQTRTHKGLRKSRYTAIAAIEIIRDGKIVDSKELATEFTIE